MLKRLIKRAKQVAEQHVPEGIRQTGQRLAQEVSERAPDSLKHAVASAVDGVDRLTSELLEGSADESAKAPPQSETEDVIGEIAVVVFGYPEDPEFTEAQALLEGEDVEFRAMNLHQQPRAAQQIASVTGVMQPPYVYIHGRFWGGLGALQSLIGLGELAAVVDNRVEDLSNEARRIGKIREAYDDALTIDNICARLREGHILAVDGIDCWFEKGISEASGRVYYDGKPHPATDLERIATDIVERATEEPQLAIKWLFEPEVGLDG